MKRNGRAPSGAQRWRCRSCGASATHSNDVAARELAAFVGWLLSRGTQADMPGRGRTFRRRAALFWPICVYCQALADKIGVMISTLSAFCVPTAFPTSEICQA